MSGKSQERSCPGIGVAMVADRPPCFISLQDAACMCEPPRHDIAVQAFVVHQPSCFEAVWRCGALPALMVTTAKGVGRQGETDAITALLPGVYQAPAPGQQPWFAASAERQQFVMLVLARIAGAAAEMLLACTNDTIRQISLSNASRQRLTRLLDQLHAAAQQLGGQPLLRQQLEAAAPALLPDADAVQSIVQPYSSRSNPDDPDGVLLILQPAPLQLLVSLSQQLDPLALGLRLPGCYNPACTSLAGASEAAMPLKLCAGCRIAR